jgi:outer membrane cobalamin receptor
MRSRFAWATVLALAVGGCGVTAAQSSEDSSPRPGGRSIDAEDIEASSARTAWDALRLLGAYLRLEEDKDRQPAQMTSRGRSSIHLSSEPQVFLDGVRIVEYTVLHQMNARLIERIDFVTGPSASIRYGTNAGNGVIVIRTRTADSGG